MDVVCAVSKKYMPSWEDLCQSIQTALNIDQSLWDEQFAGQPFGKSQLQDALKSEGVDHEDLDGLVEGIWEVARVPGTQNHVFRPVVFRISVHLCLLN